MTLTPSASIAIVLLIASPVLAQTPSTPVAPGAAPLQADSNRQMGDAFFLFKRTNYFRVLTRQLRCDQLDNALFRDANKRFEDARLRLVARFGDLFFPADMPVNAPPCQGSCDMGTLSSYANHVAEFERFADTLK
jgi:hypothetical protein